MISWALVTAEDPHASVHLGDGPRRVLLLHGLTGTPFEVRPIADALHAAGFAVRAPLHAGHRDPEELATPPAGSPFASTSATETD